MKTKLLKKIRKEFHFQICKADYNTKSRLFYFDKYERILGIANFTDRKYIPYSNLRTLLNIKEFPQKLKFKIYEMLHTK